MVDNIIIRGPFNDHNIVICDIVVSIQTKEWREACYDFNKVDYNGMKMFLVKYDRKRAFREAEVST